MVSHKQEGLAFAVLQAGVKAHCSIGNKAKQKLFTLIFSSLSQI